MDSHLKPYRCKNSDCAKHQFSSTACLLRHEREAHGLHGHGDKPYACLFQDCDRHFPGNGFPRRWNLYDHMKRCHQYEPEVTSGTDSPSPPSTSSFVSADVKPPVRRKMSSDNSKAVVSKKTKARNLTKNSTKSSKAQAVPSENFAWEQRLHIERTLDQDCRNARNPAEIQAYTQR